MVLAIGSAGLAYYRNSAAEAQDATIYGNVDIREASLAFRVAGRVLSLQVDEGDLVKPGDVLATLDPEPLQNSLHATEGAVRRRIPAHNPFGPLLRTRRRNQYWNACDAAVGNNVVTWVLPT